MATITSSPSTHPSHVGTLAAVTPTRLYKPLKRSPCRQSKEGFAKPFPSLRDSYLAASLSTEEGPHTISNSPRLVAVLDLDISKAPDTQMAPLFNYKRLSSGPSSPAPINDASTVNASASDQEMALNTLQPGIISSPTASLKAVYEKPLPPKPNLRPQESPERRGVFDAQDLTANSLNVLYPPLEPASSPDIYRSNRQSPAPISFRIAPSLLSRNQSPNSVSTAEFGVATATTIQAVINSQIAVDADHTYALNAPGSSKIPRLGSRLRNGQLTFGSPSRSHNLGSNVNRSMLRGRQALSVRGRQSQSTTNARRGGQNTVQQGDAQVESSRSNIKNSLEGSATDKGTQRTSKYGYKIRESLEAREAIMGEAGSTISPPARTPLHPPRTSSLPKTPSPRAIGPASNAESLPTRPSLLHRQTAASTARASFNAKKISESRASTSRIPQSRTLASLGDVGKGMKNFGKKVGKIIPHRRSIATVPTSDENLKATSEHIHEPSRQASRLLTTYKNSGMEESSEAIPCHSVKIADRSTQPEVADRHEPDGADKEKKIWSHASHNRAHDSETGGFVHFGQQDADSGDDEDEERPPSRHGIRVVPGGHYVEHAVEQGGDSIIDFADLVEDENARDAELLSTRRGSIESSATAVTVETNDTPVVVGNNDSARSLFSDPQFDQILTETESRARHLLSFAFGLDNSPVRTLMIETATHLAEGIMHTRQARIDIVRSSQALDEATVILAANTHRMSSILRELSAQMRANRST